MKRDRTELMKSSSTNYEQTNLKPYGVQVNQIKNMKAFSKKTNEEVYLEWLNDYLTIQGMANNYNRDAKEIKTIIDKGRQERIEKFESLKTNNII